MCLFGCMFVSFVCLRCLFYVSLLRTSLVFVTMYTSFCLCLFTFVYEWHAVYVLLPVSVSVRLSVSVCASVCASVSVCFGRVRTV